MSLQFYAPLNHVKTSQQAKKLEGMVLRQTDQQNTKHHRSHVFFRLKSAVCFGKSWRWFGHL